MLIDLTNLSLDELKTLQKDVSKAISSFESRKRKEALAAAEAAAREAGFSLNDLFGSGKNSPKLPSIPKYQHPENAAIVWTGKGRQPAWFKEAVAAGTSLDDLLINK
jgi:DNA-binding protein H-NS